MDSKAILHFADEAASDAFLAMIGPRLRDKYTLQKYQTQFLCLPDEEHPSEVTFQARRLGVLRAAFGLRQNATVNMRKVSQQVVVDIGNAAWVDKVAAGAVGMFVFAGVPLLVSLTVGSVKQRKLLKALEEDIKLAAGEMQCVLPTPDALA